MSRPSGYAAWSAAPHRGSVCTVTSRRALQVLLALFGVVAVVAGAAAVLTGSAGVVGAGRAPASVDSELRYFAAWYAAAGVLVLRAVPRVETEMATVRVVCLALLTGAAGRVLSIADLGRPPDSLLLLLAVEVALPVVVLPWHAAIARAARHATS